MTLFQDRWPGFVKVASAWSASFEQVRRVGLGALLLHWFPSHGAAFTSLESLVLVRFDEDGADFVYQINRWLPLPSVGQDFTLNRISRWSVSDVEMSGGSVRAPAAVLELDVNTSATWQQPIAATVVAELMARIEREAAAIAREGDRSLR